MKQKAKRNRDLTCLPHGSCQEDPSALVLLAFFQHFKSAGGKMAEARTMNQGQENHDNPPYGKVQGKRGNPPDPDRGDSPSMMMGC